MLLPSGRQPPDDFSKACWIYYTENNLDQTIDVLVGPDVDDLRDPSTDIEDDTHRPVMNYMNNPGVIPLDPYLIEIDKLHLGPDNHRIPTTSFT